jgi:hypothetical protein
VRICASLGNAVGFVNIGCYLRILLVVEQEEILSCGKHLPEFKPVLRIVYNVHKRLCGNGLCSYGFCVARIPIINRDIRICPFFEIGGYAKAYCIKRAVDANTLT